MAKLVYALNTSLDGYVDHLAFRPGPAVFRHFVDNVREQTCLVYGRRMYEIMRYWDDDRPEWNADEREYAQAWRGRPKWVASRSHDAVGPNATLLAEDAIAAIRDLKATLAGEISVAGPNVARSLSEARLIDEFRLYVHPVVVGTGTPFFAAPPPPLRFVACDDFGEDVVRLTYALR